MRILYVIGSLGVGGTEKQLYLLLKYVNRKRFSPLVVSLSEGGYWAERIREIGVELKELHHHKRYEMGRLFALVNIIRKESPGIIHCYHPAGNRYGWLAAKLLGTQRNTVVSIRSSFEYVMGNLNTIKRITDWLIYRDVGAAVCNSDALLRDLVRRYGNGTTRAVVIRNGIEPVQPSSKEEMEEARASLRIPASSKVVGTAGRLDPEKNHRFFLDVARQVLRAVPDTMFVIVGGGPLERDLRDYAKLTDISDHVVFTGFRSDVTRLLSAFDLFLLTSSSQDGKGEGLPNAVMEAMMCGLPCVAFDAGGIRELFKNEEAGYLVNPEDLESVVGRTVELLHHGERRAEMGSRGFVIMNEKYSASQMAREFENLYFSILKVTQ